MQVKVQHYKAFFKPDGLGFCVRYLSPPPDMKLKRPKNVGWRKPCTTPCTMNSERSQNIMEFYVAQDCYPLGRLQYIALLLFGGVLSRSRG